MAGSLQRAIWASQSVVQVGTLDGPAAQAAATDFWHVLAHVPVCE
jgi:hypothetical protein